MQIYYIFSTSTPCCPFSVSQIENIITNIFGKQNGKNGINNQFYTNYAMEGENLLEL